MEAYDEIEEVEENEYNNQPAVETIGNLMPNISLVAVKPDCLLKDQQRAYNIVYWYLQETLEGHKPPQLLMILWLFEI